VTHVVAAANFCRDLPLRWDGTQTHSQLLRSTDGFDKAAAFFGWNSCPALELDFRQHGAPAGRPGNPANAPTRIQDMPRGRRNRATRKNTSGVQHNVWIAAFAAGDGDAGEIATAWLAPRSCSRLLAAFSIHSVTMRAVSGAAKKTWPSSSE